MAQKPPTKSHFGAIKISTKTAEKFINAVNKHAGNHTMAGAEFGLTRDQMRRRISQVAIQHKLYPKNFSLLEARQGLAATPEQQATVELHKERASHSYTRTQLQQVAADVERLSNELHNFRFAAKTSEVAADWALPTRKTSKSDHLPVLFVSDAQAGEVIDKDEIEYGRGYNTKIFIERYRELIATTIYLLTHHVGPDWKFPGFIYVRGGDAISGGIHEELRDTDDMTPLEAVRVVFEEEAAGIRHLADAFGRVEVKSVSGGNHDRTTFKPRTKNRTGHSYDALIDYMLADHFKNDKRVTFQLTKSTDVVFPVFNKLILATHGDNIGSGGGTGFVGAGANIIKGGQKVMMEQAKLGKIIDMVMTGHFHTLILTDSSIGNGSFPGYSEFAKSFRMKPEPARQVLTIWHATRGLVDIKPIVMK